MNVVSEITKMRSNNDCGKLCDINVIQAHLKQYDHPDSKPGEIWLKTRDVLTEKLIIELQFLIKDESEFRKPTYIVSSEYKKIKGGLNEYTLYINI